MKKIYSLVCALAVTTLAVAQQAEPTIKLTANKAVLKKTMTINNTNYAAAKTAAVGDTTGWSNFTDYLPEFAPSGSLANYGYLGGGYVYGKNKDSLNVCAAGFINVSSAPTTISKVIFLASEKSGVGTDPNSKLTVRLWDMAANKAYSYGTTWVQDKNGPNTVKTATTVAYTAIDTNWTASASFPWTVATFSAPVTVSTDFAIEFNSVTLNAQDTVGFISDAAADQGGLQLTYHKQWYGGTSYSPWVVTDGGYFTAGALDNTIAAFAIVDANSGVNEYINGIKLNALYPNPTKDVATIAYSLEKSSSNVSLEVFAVNGQKAYSQKFGNQEAGEYKITLDASNLSAGSYFYQLRANGAVITKEFVVTK